MKQTISNGTIRHTALRYAFSSNAAAASGLAASGIDPDMEVSSYLSLLCFLKLVRYANQLILIRPAAVDHVNRARGERGLIGGEIRHQRGDFFRAPDPADRLTRNERGADLFFVQMRRCSLACDPATQRRRFNRAWTNRVATNGLAHEVSSHGFRQTDHGPLQCAVNKAVRHAFHAGRR